MAENNTDTDIAGTPLSFFGMITNVLLRPKRAFNNLAIHASRAWIVWALLALALTVVPAFLTNQYSSVFRGMAEQPSSAQSEAIVLDGNASNAEISPSGQAQPIPNNFQTTVTIFSAVSKLVTTLVSWLMWAGIIFLISSMGGGRGSFSKLFQMATWAHLPFALRDIIQSVYMSVTQTAVGMPGLSGLVAANNAEIVLDTVESGVFVPPTPPSTGEIVTQTLLGKVELYHFWHLLLLIIGVIAIAKLSRGRAIAIVIGLWLLGVAVQIVPALAFRGFGGV